eukprot:gnl/Dysnectes_brevis/36128_a751441_10.p2 GENE.gnl/Dysnectes_brevis/36128_a751441_10~~gnl/Dysnectes_brevis/36128_a751441_10.p2  ORF type:complete len:145 (-),score=49.80 gnl/Dysnectes_brevis/36128_a751441_10:20-454(-)
MLQLHVYEQWQAEQRSQRWCESHYLSHARLLQAEKVRRQLAGILRRDGKPLRSCGGDAETVLRCLAQGFCFNTARAQRGGSYRTLLGSKAEVHMHPSSALKDQAAPPFVLYHELAQTSQQFMRCVSRVEPEWLRETCPHLYSDI